MTPQDIKAVSEYALQSTTPAKVVLSQGTSATGTEFFSFCEQLSKLVPHVSMKKDSDISFEAPVIVTGRHGNIAYYALPTGKFLPLFLATLDRGPVAEPMASHQMDLPAGLKLYVADQCPHCPQALRQMQILANSTAMIRLRIINIETFPERARNDQVKSVPTLILDDQFRWIGQVNTEELLAICAGRDPSELSADSLRRLIEDGQAAKLATTMIESKKVFPALVELLSHQRWSVRLGAMVTAEYLADEDPVLGLDLCQRLWQKFPDMNPQAQGDVTHIFGLVDHETPKGYLRNIAKGDFGSEVKEAAQEALEETGGIKPQNIETQNRRTSKGGFRLSPE